MKDLLGILLATMALYGLVYCVVEYTPAVEMLVAAIKTQVNK